MFSVAFSVIEFVQYLKHTSCHSFWLHHINVSRKNKSSLIIKNCSTKTHYKSYDVNEIKLKQSANIQMLNVWPKIKVEINEGWTFYVNHQYLETSQDDNILLVELEESNELDENIFDMPSRYLIRFSEIVTPIAWMFDNCLKILAQSSTNNLAIFCKVQHFNSIIYDDNLHLKSLTTVDMVGRIRAKSLLRGQSALLDKAIKNKLNLKYNDSICSTNNESLKNNQYVPKPPNLLIYTSNVKDFNNFHTLLKNVFGNDRYTFHHLKEENVLKTPWQYNSSLLIIASSKLSGIVTDTFFDYYKSGGKIFSICCQQFEEKLLKNKKIDKSQKLGNCKLSCAIWEDIEVIGNLNDNFEEEETFEEIAWFTENNSKRVAAIISNKNIYNSIVLFSHIQFNLTCSKKHLEIFKFLLSKYFYLDCGDTENQQSLQLTLALLFCNDENSKMKLLDEIKRICVDGTLISKNVNLKFIHEKETMNESATNNLLPIIGEFSNDNINLLYFNEKEYFQNLKTKALGKMLIYADVMNSTHTILEQLQFMALDNCYLAVIAGRQVSGIGRSSNTWLSPPGTLAISFHFKTSINSNIGRHAPFVQHIAALSVVEAIRSLSEYENINVRIKWPNDIYFDDKKKIGGIIVNSTMFKDYMHFIIGIGVNVDNSKPTTCLNELIEDYGKLHDKNIKPFSVQQLAALILNKFEELTDLYMVESKKVLDIYYQRWLHSGKNVELFDGKIVTIIDLDEFGFLRVMSDSKEIIVVQPDGNTFDMTKGLILNK